MAAWRRVLLQGVLVCALGVIGMHSQVNSANAGDSLRPMSFEDIDGWSSDGVADAFPAFRLSCARMMAAGDPAVSNARYGGRITDWRTACEDARVRGNDLSDHEARNFFERHFRPFAVNGPTPGGLFTGYFEPELEGSRHRGGDYTVPLLRRPDDLVAFDQAVRQRLGVDHGRVIDGRPRPYATRREIESGALDGRNLEFLWLRNWEDAFFLHIQGSGRVALRDGSVTRVGFAAKNGHPYTPIGRLLVERGEIARSEISMQSIRAWLEANPNRARELMWENDSYIFFREIDLPDPLLGPVGAQGVQLTPGRSLAVDRSYYSLGTPVWVAADTPSGADGEMVAMARLFVAQDVGSAITGRVRGDIFWGAGAGAGEIAGRMQSPGVMIVLIPQPLADRLGHGG